MLALIAIGAFLGACYLISCWFLPYKPCGHCKGTGQIHSTSFKGAFGDCWRCQGTGRKRRGGARLLGRGEDK
ncbi:hypothetical protein [Microbispora sp. ATCC PTA-5024]|uniref:hypothetical protein n=1 Tax=Microbispora sp. ATCC PTA-5024 TaxID=316330 RepID=UPI0003DC8934|nr:hypothetical protein [Microbispora sp. ATCC PTA-5024]ETK36099.1 hypothetical protein MPTA5024_10770 [Microbispora sp. ATCC PTA-5024]